MNGSYKNYEITSPNPSAFDKYRILFFYENREYHDQFMPILDMCGLKDIDKFDDISDTFNQLIANDYDMVIIAYLDSSDKSVELVKECRALSLDLPFVAITEKGLGLKGVLGIYSQGIDEIVWPPLSANKLLKLLESLINRNKNDQYKEEHVRARELLENGDLEEAEIAYKRLLTQNAYVIDASLALSVICNKQKKHKEAKHLLLNAQAYAKNIPNLVKKTYQLSRVIYYLGELYRDIGDMDNAVRHFRAALSMNPHLNQSVSRLSECFREQGNADELTALAQEARKTYRKYSPDLSKVAYELLELASHYDAIGMQSKAQELFYYLLAYPHANPDVHTKVADFFWRQDQFSSVINSFDKLISANVKVPEVLAKYGECLLDIHKYHMEYRDDEDESNPNHGRFGSSRGLGVVDSAREMLQEALLHNQALIPAWINLIRCYARKSDEDQANDMLRRFLSAREKTADILLQLISALFDEDAFDLASDLVRDGMQEYPNEGQFYIYRAKYLRHYDKIYDAVGTLKQGLQVDSENTEMMVGIGDAYMELGQAAEAVNYFEQASRIMPADDEIKRKLTDALILKSESKKKKRPLPIGS